MASKKISALTAATAIAGTEVFPIVQAAATVKATFAQVLTYIGITLAPKASPTFTGTPAAPTAAVGTNTTQIATTAFVAAERLSPQAPTVVRDDFLWGSTESGELGELGWGFTNGNFNPVNPEANHPGIAERASTAAAGTVASTYSGSGGTTVLIQFGQLDEQTWIVKPKTADTDYDIRVGLFSDATANPPTNGVYFEKLAADTNWFGVARISGVQTREDLDVAYAADWVKVKIRRIDASTVGFTINGGAEQTIASNVPLGTNTMALGFQVIPGSANARSLYIDFFAMRLAAQTR